MVHQRRTDDTSSQTSCSHRTTHHGASTPHGRYVFTNFLLTPHDSSRCINAARTIRHHKLPAHTAQLITVHQRRTDDTSSQTSCSHHTTHHGASRPHGRYVITNFLLTLHDWSRSIHAARTIRHHKLPAHTTRLITVHQRRTDDTSSQTSCSHRTTHHGASTPHGRYVFTNFLLTPHDSSRCINAARTIRHHKLPAHTAQLITVHQRRTDDTSSQTSCSHHTTYHGASTPHGRYVITNFLLTPHNSSRCINAARTIRLHKLPAHTTRLITVHWGRTDDTSSQISCSHHTTDHVPSKNNNWQIEKTLVASR